MTLLIAIIRLLFVITINKIKSSKIYLPGRFLELFSIIIWAIYKNKVYAKEIDFNGIKLEDYIIKTEKYDLVIDSINLRLKTISYYSKKLGIRLIQLIPVDIKNKKYLIVENSSNYINQNLTNYR